MPASPHIPHEAQITPSPESVQVSEPVAVKLQCPNNLENLSLETIVKDSFQYTSDFLLSPSGEQMAIRTSDGISIFSLITGERRQTELSDFLRFWIDENSLVLSYHEEGQFKFYAFNLETRQKTRYEMRWEYNDLASHTVAAQYYTGWQAAANLEVSKQTICKAVHDGRLKTLEASDESLLLLREDLLEHGSDLIREEHPDLFPYDTIARLRETAQSVSSVVSIQVESPVRQAYWYRILVLTGLPDEPHNLLVQVSSESHWEGYPITTNQLVIDKGDLAVWTGTNTEFFVARDPCDNLGDEGYRYVLYHRNDESRSPVAVGVIPYLPEYWTKMVWSPDGRYIYVKQPVEGVWSISRLTLLAH